MEQSRYHKFLRVSAVVVTLVLLFDGGFIAPVTQTLSDNTVHYLANSIGLSVAVPPNELNVITAELTAKERELDAREEALASREIAAREFTSESDTDYSTYLLSSILFILLVLILLNYAMDWVRYHRQTGEQAAV